MEQQAGPTARRTWILYLELLTGTTLIICGPSWLPVIVKLVWQALLKRVSEYDPLTITILIAAAAYAFYTSFSWLLEDDHFSQHQHSYDNYEFPRSRRAEYQSGRAQPGRYGYAEQQQQRRYQEQQHRHQQQQQRQHEEHQRQQQKQQSDKWEGMMGFGSQKPPPGCRGAVFEVLSAADYYQVLKVHPSNLSPETLKKARKARQLEVHPDKAGIDAPGATQAGQRVNLAFDTLSDHVARREYDAWLTYKRPPPRPRADPYFSSGSGDRPSSSSSTGQAGGRTAGGASSSSGGAGRSAAAGSGRGGGSSGSSGRGASKRRGRKR